MLPEAIVVVRKHAILYIASEEMVVDTCLPSIIIIDNTTKQLETIVSLIA